MTIIDNYCHKGKIRIDKYLIIIKMATKTQSLHISLPIKMHRHIQKQSKQKNYSTASDFIQSIIRENMEKEEQLKLEKMLLEGLASGNVAYDKKTWIKTKERILAKI